MKPPVKTLSIRHPWAELIIQGYKDFENRTWKTNFRGEIYIHAGKKFDREGYLFVRKNFTQIEMDNFDFQYGGIVGTAEVVDCVSDSLSPWFLGPYGFALKNAKKIPFIPCRGALGFFKAEI